MFYVPAPDATKITVGGVTAGNSYTDLPVDVTDKTPFYAGHIAGGTGEGGYVGFIDDGGTTHQILGEYSSGSTNDIVENGWIASGTTHTLRVSDCVSYIYLLWSK
jgi:hypothetical protein